MAASAYFQRLAQERASGVRAADVIECSDITALLAWKRQGWLTPFVPADVAQKWPANQRDSDAISRPSALRSPRSLTTRNW
jgi:ABC-type Fe3+ transport system substrate-binding protein